MTVIAAVEFMPGGHALHGQGSDATNGARQDLDHPEMLEQF